MIELIFRGQDEKISYIVLVIPFHNLRGSLKKDNWFLLLTADRHERTTFSMTIGGKASTQNYSHARSIDQIGEKIYFVVWMSFLSCAPDWDKNELTLLIRRNPDAMKNLKVHALIIIKSIKWRTRRISVSTVMTMQRYSDYSHQQHSDEFISDPNQTLNKKIQSVWSINGM